MKLAKYIGAQFARPTGAAGRAAAFLMSRMNRAQYRAVEEGLASVRRGRILDVGFGSGRLTGALAGKKPGCTFYGVELSEDMLASAKMRNEELLKQGRVFLGMGDVAALPYPDGFFRGVYTVNTAYFWNGPERCLREILRVLEPGGVFLSAFYEPEFLDRLPYTSQGFPNKYPAERWERLALAAGFSSVETRGIRRGRSGCLIAAKP